MNLLRRLITIVWVCALVVTGVALFLYNPDPVQLDLIWWQTPPMGLAALVFAVFLVGLLSGLMLAVVTRLFGRP
ncbi:MAG: DUF1049 domain-containing protein [Gammaproteobacteria bacterium]|nr:DUF1049 domain-containing protein [Gammaproteobacteria bacterium]